MSVRPSRKSASAPPPANRLSHVLFAGLSQSTPSIAAAVTPPPPLPALAPKPRSKIDRNLSDVIKRQLDLSVALGTGAEPGDLTSEGVPRYKAYEDLRNQTLAWLEDGEVDAIEVSSMLSNLAVEQQRLLAILKDCEDRAASAEPSSPVSPEYSEFRDSPPLYEEYQSEGGGERTTAESVQNTMISTRAKLVMLSSLFAAGSLVWKILQTSDPNTGFVEPTNPSSSASEWAAYASRQAFGSYAGGA